MKKATTDVYKRQMFICLVAALAVIGRSEQMAVPQLAQDGMVDISEVSQAGGNICLLYTSRCV